MAKGEMQFTTIALLVITAVVLIAVIIWFLPSFADTGKTLTDVGDTAGTTATDVIVAKCETLCGKINTTVEADILTTSFCSEEDCVITSEVTCTAANTGGTKCKGHGF